MEAGSNAGEKVSLEVETLLKASAYILGASGTSIMYKAVLEDGTVLAVRRVGESNSVEKLKEFEGHVRAIAKLVHPNLVKVRGFYWGSDEKLIIYEYISNGSLANARYSKLIHLILFFNRKLSILLLSLSLRFSIIKDILVLLSVIFFNFFIVQIR